MLAVGIIGLLVSLAWVWTQGMFAALFVPQCQPGDTWTLQGKCLWVAVQLWAAELCALVMLIITLWGLWLLNAGSREAPHSPR